MADHTPEGYILLSEAFQMHFEKRYGFSPTMETGDIVSHGNEYEAIHLELVRGFADKEIEALYRIPFSANENLRLPVAHWREIRKSAELYHQDPEVNLSGIDWVFLIDLVQASRRDHPWNCADGRKPFVAEVSFREWSQKALNRPSPHPNTHSKAPRRYDHADVTAFFVSQYVTPFENGVGERITRDEWCQIAKSQFPGITITAARAVYDSTRPDKWAKPGPRFGRKDR